MLQERVITTTASRHRESGDASRGQRFQDPPPGRRNRAPVPHRPQPKGKIAGIPRWVYSVGLLRGKIIVPVATADRYLSLMPFRARLKLLFGCGAILYAFLLLAVCGVISWGSWQSGSPWFRFQTAALLRGSFALSHNPLDLTHDLCWSEGGVHQVWGLGIPLWQLPFAAVAKLLGLSPFPDRIALGLFIALVAYVVLRTWFGSLLDHETELTASAPPRTNPSQWFNALGLVILSLFFPPLINLMRYRMLVYEEVMVYVYFWGILLLCGAIELARKPQWRRFWLLCSLAGLGGFIRPTLVFYGFATVAVAGLVMACHERQPSRCGTKPVHLLKSIGNRHLLFGLLFFLSGGGLLFITNYLRFGSGWEFGHRLNLQGGSLLPSVYFTRFGYPFSQVPLTESLRELFGSLFQEKNFSDLYWYAPNIFPGQDSIIRWREFSFTTYDISYAFLIGLSWAIGARMVWKWSCSLNMGSPRALSMLIILWSALVVLPLVVFYMKVPLLASRYMLDFGPAFVAALVGLWYRAVEELRQRMWHSNQIAGLLFIALILWLGSEVALAKRADPSPAPLIKETLADQASPSSGLDKYLPEEYRVGGSLSSPSNGSIQYNGAWWDSTSCSTRLCAIFFVDNPEFLELELTAYPGRDTTEAPLTAIRAKAGLETLEQTSITHTNETWIVRFAGPRQRRYQRGLQPVFLAMIPTQELARYITLSSPWILKRLTWRTE